MAHMKPTISMMAAAVLLAAGCTSRLPGGKPVYVYVASNGTVSFRGDSMKAGELPANLKSAGAVPSTHIILVAQGEVPLQHLHELVQECGNAGLPNCTIRSSRKITVEKVEKPRR